MAEVRNLSVMFADLVDSTGMSDILELEDQYELQRHFQSLAITVVEKFDGFIARSLGDGLLVYFGYPTARETDAERSIRAGLEIVEQVRSSAFKCRNGSEIKLAVRVGIHTGRVVLGATGTRSWQTEYEIVGKAPNVAARLQSSAVPNSVVISEDTFGLVAGHFRVEDLGQHHLRGVSDRVNTFRVTGVQIADARFDGPMGGRNSPLVGRRSELEKLKLLWARAEAAGALTVKITGDAGVGKSRLLWEFRREVEVGKTTLIQFNCSEFYSSTPLHPIASVLALHCEFRADDDHTTKARKLSDKVGQKYGLSDTELWAIADLIGVGSSVPQPHSPLNAIEIKRAKFTTLGKVLRAMTLGLRSILIVEDIHWIDPSSAELLRELAPELARTPTLIIVTTRQSNLDGFLPEPDETIDVTELSQGESVELAKLVPGAKYLSEEQLVLVAQVSEGVPLFIEQMTISIVRQQSSSSSLLKSPSIPPSLSDLLTARLDREPGARTIMQVAAVIGRSFEAELLGSTLDKSADEIRRALHVLVDATVLEPRRQQSDESYQFRHALLQRAAYESLLPSDRRRYHGSVAANLDGHVKSGRVPTEVLAHHLSGAEIYDKAALAWAEAGIQAARKSAYYESISHLRRGLDLLKNLPTGAASVELETRLQVALIGPLVALKGFASQEVNDCCRRGLALCQNSPNSSLAFPFLYGLTTWAISRGYMEQTANLAEEFLNLARRRNYESGIVIGSRLRGMAYFGQGHSPEALKALQTSLIHYVPERDEAITYLFGQNAKVSGQSVLALILYHVGDIDQAIAMSIETINIAQSLRHPLSIALALSYAGQVYGFCGDWVRLRDIANRLTSLSIEYKMSVFYGYGQAYLGWAEIEDGSAQEGVQRIEQTLTSWEEANWHLTAAFFIALLGEGYRKLGNPQNALHLCSRSKIVMLLGGDRWFEPEVYRIEASSLRDVGDIVGAREAINVAISSAKRMSSPPMWLRVALKFIDDEVLEDLNLSAEIQGALAAMAPSEYLVDQVSSREWLRRQDPR